jgi:predicted TIM-barrel fold metal-dependent hydrolase
MEYRVISTDDHVMDAPDTFQKRLPAKYRDRAPRILRGADGGDGWSWDGKPPKNTFGLGAVGGRAYKDYKSHGLTLDEILPGNFDGEAHLKDMLADGVDAATIFSGAAATLLMDDREFGLACLHVSNDWLLDEFCAVAPDRLLALPSISMEDGEQEMVGEAERMIAKGAHGLYLPYNTSRPYYSTYYDPLWKVLEQTNTAAVIHRNHGGRMPTAETGAGVVQPDAAPGLNVAGIVERFFSGIVPLTRLIYTGLFERFPNLHVVDAEVNCGWVPFWVQMMEQEYERQQHWANLPISQNPVNFVGKNVFVTALDDFVGFEMAKTDDVLARTVTYSTDYPHSTTLWPHSKEFIAKLTDGMDAERKHAVLAGNAVRAFSLA